jgi:hypothetical protein
MRLFTTTAFLAATSLNPLRAEKAVNLSDLPPAVQKTVQQQLKGGQIKSITKETEKGIVQYEVESMLGDKHRDFNVDTSGKLTSVEEEASLDTIPGLARDALLKGIGAGKLRRVEIVTEGDKTRYEASYTSRGGKKHEITVRPDGTAANE